MLCRALTLPCLLPDGLQGGNRLVGAIRGPGIKQRKYEFGLMHGADWMPSLLSHVVGSTDGWKTLIPKVR